MKPVVLSFFLCLSFFLYGLSGRKLHMKWCKLPQKTNLVTHTYTHTHTCSQTPALREASSLWLRQNPLWQTQEGSGPINDTHTLSFFSKRTTPAVEASSIRPDMPSLRWRFDNDNNTWHHDAAGELRCHVSGGGWGEVSCLWMKASSGTQRCSFNNAGNLKANVQKWKWFFLVELNTHHIYIDGIPK